MQIACLSPTTSLKEEAVMGGFMTGWQFGVKVGWRVGIFLALTIGFPFIVYGLIVATGGRGVGGAAGAVAVAAGAYLKPVIILGFVISLLSPSWKRMRSLGFPGFVGLLVPLLVWLDWPYLMIVGAHWGVGFSLGILRVDLPLFAMTALAMLVAMSVASPPDVSSPSQRIAVRICGILAILLAVISLLAGGTSLWFAARIWFFAPGGPMPVLLLTRFGYWAFIFKPFVCGAFCVAMAATTYLSRKESSGHSPGGSVTGGVPVVRSPPSAAPDPSRVVFGGR
jgi:hypothetical protein